MQKTAFLLCIFLAAAPAWGQPVAPTGRLVVPAAEPFVVLSMNGEPLRLKVDLGAHGTIILNPQAAARAGLEQDGTVTMRIGPVNLRGSRASPAFQLGDARWTSDVMWFDRSYVEDADGLVSPHHLPFAHVEFEGQGQGHTPFLLKARYSDERGVFNPIRVAGKTIAVRFSLLQPRSSATGAAGALLAKQQNGQLHGSAIQQHLGWDISRPTRRLAMAEPWLVGRLSLSEILVRLRDFRGKTNLPMAATESGPTDILVTGRIRERQSAEHFMTIGLDQLQTCGSIIYLRQTKQLFFRC